MQNYENYWKLTVEYTDINGNKFLETLNKIVNFIKSYEYMDEILYKKLQSEIHQLEWNSKKDLGSVRKSINQFIKLGFINNKLNSEGYGLNSINPETQDFLSSKDSNIRELIFSKIFYKYSSFSSSVTNYSASKEIDFIIKTLINTGKLSKDDIGAMMLIDINIDPIASKGFFSQGELKSIKNINFINFKSRKYNQINYLWNFLKKIEILTFNNDEFEFTNDPYVKIKSDENKNKNNFSKGKKRDSAMQIIMKDQLKLESENKLGSVMCMLSQIEYISLICSHIKPFRFSNEDEEYDPENGLLLSLDIDNLFDHGNISFDDHGNVLVSESLKNKNVAEKLNLNSIKLPKKLMTNKRKEYLKYHRNSVFIS